MYALILHPAAAPREVAVADLNLSDESPAGCLARWNQAAHLLELAPAAVATMDAGADYVVFRQTTGARNPAAEQLLPRFLVGEVFGREDDDQCRIYGAVVVLTVRTSSCLSQPPDSLHAFCGLSLLRLARGRAWLV